MKINKDLIIEDTDVTLKDIAEKSKGDGFARAHLTSVWNPGADYSKCPLQLSYSSNSNISISNGNIVFESNVKYAEFTISLQNNNWAATAMYIMLNYGNGSVAVRNYTGQGNCHSLTVTINVTPGVNYYFSVYNNNTAISADYVYSWATIKAFG